MIHVMRSGASFPPLAQGLHTKHTRAGPSDTTDSDAFTELEVIGKIITDLPLSPLVQRAINEENRRHESGEGDCEGAELSICPSKTNCTTAALRLQPEASAPMPAKPPLKASSLKGSVERRRSKESSNARRRSQAIHKRLLEAGQYRPCLDYRPRRSTAGHLPKLDSAPFKVKSQGLPAAKGGWVGKQSRSQRRGPWLLQELIESGFSVFPWDGRTPHALLDDENRIIAMLAGCPNDETWTDTAKSAAELLSEERSLGKESGAFSQAHSAHRRGQFVALASGVSHGNGRLAPGNLVHPDKRRALLNRLIANNHVKRIAGFQSSAFAFYAPKLYRHYSEQLQELFDHDSHLKANFRNSVFPAATFNLGPATVTLDHTDPGNVAYGWCALTALGSYNHKLGGHLILFDLNLVVEFPPGATILIPSSILRHANTPIQADETRFSISQYCAGGLFRWVSHGFRSASSASKGSRGKKPKLSSQGSDSSCTEAALELFSKIDELHTDRLKIFG